MTVWDPREHKTQVVARIFITHWALWFSFGQRGLSYDGCFHVARVTHARYEVVWISGRRSQIGISYTESERCIMNRELWGNLGDDEWKALSAGVGYSAAVTWSLAR